MNSGNDSVERDAQGVPTAFRIWRAGANPTDYGQSNFDKESARLLMEEQATRGNLYSIDINHLSLNPAAPLENQRSVGTFALEVRNGELWAVDCKWSPEIRAQLSRGEWPSISPAYDVDMSGRIVSFTNLALTGTPATHGATRLAATRIAASRSPYSHHSVEFLRMVASRKEPELRATAQKARNELARRGIPMIDPGSPEGHALEQMRVSAGLPSQRPAIRKERNVTMFGVLTQEEAALLLANRKRR